MGQSRKAPSRGASATVVPTKSRSSTPAKPSNGVVTDTNGSANPKAHKTKKSSKRRATARPTTIGDHIFRVALLSFTLYILLVCPGDTRLESPTCRALESWRLTLSPQLSRPVNAFLAHPSVSPVVAKVKPHFDQAIRIATPYTHAVQAKAAPHIKYAQAKTRALTRPYVRRFQLEYDARIQPYVSKVQPHIYELQRQIDARVVPLVRPHIHRAQVLSAQAYAYSQHQWDAQIYPKVVRPAWEQALNIPVWLELRFGPWARELKATYVDEQFKKMSAKIEELGGISSSSASSSSTITKPPSSMTKFVNEEAAPKVTEIVSSVAGSLLSRVTGSSSSSITPDEVIETVATAQPIPTPSSSTLSVASSIKASVDLTGTPSTTAAHADETPSPAEGAEDPEPEEDPLEFLAQFTGAAREPEATFTTQVQQPQYTPPSADESEERRLHMVAKRKDLEARRANWESKIDETGKTLQARLIEEITAIRSAAVASLDESSTDPESIGAKVTAFRKSGSKALKGTLAYAKQLMAGHYHGAEKIGLYDSVIRKVDARYGEGAKELSESVALWWVGVRDEIAEKVDRYSKEVFSVAEQAQGNLGMDFSYLDDVTAKDWEKYHALLPRARAFEGQYRAIADGSAPKAPTDPLPAALAALQEDLQNYLAAFATDLINVRDEGFKLIKGKPMSEVPAGKSPAKPSGGFSILPVAEARDDFIGRGREEVLEALSRAGEKVTGTPKPSPALNQVNDIVDAIFAGAEEVYEDVKQKVHDATRKASKAAGATPTPETFNEHVESVVAAASSALPTVDVEDLKQKVHDATRKASRAVGATPTPETLNEHVESVVAAIPSVDTESVHSYIKDSASSVSSYADDTVSTASSVIVEVYEEITSTVVDAASTVSSVASSVAEDASSVIHQATRSAQSAVGVTPTPETFAETTESIKAKVHSATRQAARAAGLSVSPEGVKEHVSSVVSEASASASSVVEPASSIVASVYADVESVVESVTSKVVDTASTASSTASSVYTEASSSIHSAVRKVAKAGGVRVQPEGAQEHLEDMVEDLLSKVGATVVQPVHSATRSIAKAAGVTPSPEGVAEHFESLTEKVSSVVSDAYEDASSSVHSGARRASKAAGIKPEPTGVKEKMEDLTEEGYEHVEEVKSTVSSVVADATSVVKDAYASASSVVASKHEEL